jgi:hypothetical protein
MSLQFISDSTAETIGVFIPISEWNELKNKFKGIENEELNIPDWHVDLIRKRVREYENNPNQVLDFKTAIDDIEKDL